MDVGDFKYVICPVCVEEQGAIDSVTDYPGLLLTYGMRHGDTPAIIVLCREHGEIIFSMAIPDHVFDALENNEEHKLEGNSGEEEGEGTNLSLVRKPSDQEKPSTLETLSKRSGIIEFPKSRIIH